MSTNPVWFDAHLDLAYLAVSGRDMTQPLDPKMGPHPPAAVTLPSLQQGNVGGALATVFTEPNGDPATAEAYPAGNADAAHTVGVRQLDVYQRWAEEERIQLARTPSEFASLDSARPIFGVLIENADPVRTPDELEWWASRGVVAVGLAWRLGSRYAGGDCPSRGVLHSDSGGDGLTGAGRAMVDAIDSLKLVHDVSHLSDRAMDELLAQTNRSVIASHSNCRAIFAGTPRATQRHLRDETIAEIATRGGCIGLNLFSMFLTRNVAQQRATIDEAIDHVEHVCAIAGSRAHVGLGSDMDGGLTASDLPVGISRPGDLERLADGLRTRGWSEDEIDGFRSANWIRALQYILEH